MARWIKYGLATLVVAMLVAGFAYILSPKPVPADMALIGRGPIKVTIDEEGKTRIRDIYTVSAPITGRLLRLPVDVGDTVHAGISPVASLLPLAPSFLDLRSRSELNAAADAAEAAVGLAEAELARKQSEERFAKSNLERAERLVESATISRSAFERAILDHDTAIAAIRQAEANLELRRHELESAKARLIEPDAQANTDLPSCCIAVNSPVDGVVLKLIEESETSVQAGQPILEIGNTRNLEIVVDLLSTDAVKVAPGDLATIDGWGGPPLNAKVERVDPAGFTKVSALGIEEQRVTTVLQLTDNPDVWAALGHDFRVFVRIAEWNDDNALRVPLSALFRIGSDWGVFRVENGIARRTVIRLGHRNATHAEVLDGLTEGDRIILYPSDRIDDGIAVEPRIAAG